MSARVVILGASAFVGLCALAALAVVGWVGVSLAQWLRAKRKKALAEAFDPVRPLRGGHRR